MPDSAEGRPAKYSRTNTSNVELPTPQRGDPWLDDGNIILQTGSKQFRVVRSILSASSSVFRDMFSIPQPVDEKNGLMDVRLYMCQIQQKICTTF